MINRLLIYGEIFAHFFIYYEALRHILLCNCSTLNFLKYEKKISFLSVRRANLFTFLSSLPLLRQPPRQCLSPTCYLFTFNLHCIATCLSIWSERFRGMIKEDEHGPLSIFFLYGNRPRAKSRHKCAPVFEFFQFNFISLYTLIHLSVALTAMCL